ncbi:hypothetical protein SKAU_G00035170 [Synaphobranchus kaupii]|uniref:Proline-rich transmembrane protein 3/4 domain-containing protein n=1 Tax=Synaphobranchus kaupii TaxID=118154 RepID=A0A9Q1JGT6_SYNKA|nr:hypothetical protein SKAU_G00035170 [Synaphobranchus kaupii]
MRRTNIPNEECGIPESSSEASEKGKHGRHSVKGHPSFNEVSMWGHSWVLLLSLCQVQFGTCLATPPTGEQPARTPPRTRPGTESSVLRQASGSEDHWPFWVSVDVPAEPERSSSLSRPTSLTSDPQGPPHAGNTQGPRPGAPPSLTDSTSTSTALLPEPGARISWGEESTSTSRDTAPWQRDTELLTALTSGFTDLSPAQGRILYLVPQPTHSLRGRDAASQIPMRLTPALPPFTATPNRNTATLLPPTGALERKVPTLSLPPEAAEPQAPVPQTWRQGLIAGPAGGRAKEAGMQAQERLPQTGGSSTREGEAKTSVPNDGGVLEGVAQKPTQTLTVTTESPGYVVPDEDGPSDPGVPYSAHVPHCNGDTSGACNLNTWSPTISEDVAYNQSHGPSQAPPPAPPLLLMPLYADWNGAMATWGVAWEVHVFGVGSLFAVAGLLSALGLLLLALLRPPGGGYLALAHLLLLAASSGRAFSLFYDAYGHLDKLPAANFLLLHHAPFPCLTGAFTAVFLFLSLRSRVRLPGSPCQRPCFLAVLLLLHFGATFSSLLVLQAFPQWPFLRLVSQGASVVLMTFLSVAYLIFCCNVLADAKHVYHLSNTPPSRRGWGRAGGNGGILCALHAALRRATALRRAPCTGPGPAHCPAPRPGPLALVGVPTELPPV